MIRLISLASENECCGPGMWVSDRNALPPEQRVWRNIGHGMHVGRGESSVGQVPAPKTRGLSWSAAPVEKAGRGGASQ